MARIIMDRTGLARLDLQVERTKGHVAADVADDARRFCPVDKGELRASIRVEGNQVWVGTDHWMPAEYGSRPHEIVSHGSYPLRNRETGQVFGRRVWHPGTPAQPFLRPSLYRTRALR